MHKEVPAFCPCSVAAALLLVCAAIPALATDYSSVQNGPWSMASTWSPPGVPDSAVDNATVNHSVTADGSYIVNDLQIAGSGTLTCTADNILWLYGDWVNNGRAVLTNGSVMFVGNGGSAISGDSVTTFFKLVVNKDDLDAKVTQRQAARISYAGLGSLNVVRGTLVTNGKDLDANVANSVVTGGDNGRLDITEGGTVNIWMLQQDGLKYVSVSGNPTVNITSWQFTMGSCLFKVAGGAVNYTQTNGWNMRLFGSSPPGFGYIVTGGTVTFYGDVVSSVWTYFDVSGSGVIRFAGSSDSRFDLMNAFGGTGWAHWALNDLRIEKTGGATVRITASGTTMMDSSVTVDKGVTVNPGARLILYNPLFNGTFGFIINNLVNSGTLIDSNFTYVSGNWTNPGTFRHGANLVTFDGPGTDTLAPGIGPFHDVAVNKPAGRLAVVGNLAVEHYLTVQEGTFALAGDTLTMGTSSSAGSIAVNSGTFSAVGSAQANSGVLPAAAGFPYRCAVAPTGTIGARYALFQNMDTLGIDIAGSVDPDDNFSWCTFDHGTLAGRMLRMGNSQTIDDVAEANFYGSTGYNIEKLGTAGHVTVHGGNGTRWGEDFDNDPNNLIDWAVSGIEAGRLPDFGQPRFTISPNPLRSGFAVLHLSPLVTRNSSLGVSIFDPSGRLVLNSSPVTRNSSFSLDLSGLSAGVYLVRLSANGVTATQKLVIQR